MTAVTLIGQVLNDRYEILEKVGEGGMAVTYRGRDRVLGRVVAVKIMRPELASDGEFLARFRREARAAAGVTHEHIASIYDTGSDGPLHYIVMEYVEGESMKERLRREGPLPLAEALRIAAETAEALEAAHEAGIVHRDIKPHNILLGRGGQVKVTDFGIARAASSTGQTETGRILGTVSYVSPEQARGEAVGPQGDLYSLGVTLFEALTGRVPFNGGDRMAVLHKHIYDRPPSVRETRPGLPPEVDFIVSRCLEKDLSRRFASARELHSYLALCPREEVRGWGRWGPRRWLEGAARALHSAGWRWRRRALWAALAVIVAAGSIVGTTMWASARGRATMIAVPDVVGMSSSAARKYLEQAGLGYREVGSRPSDDVAAGKVLSQNPAAGVLASPADVVKVVISEGSHQVTVPDVAQMSVAQAQRNLEAAGLTSGAVQEAYDPKVPANYVARTLPAAGARVVRGTAVDLVVSLGPQPEVPPGPPPAPPGGTRTREETLSYVVPADVGGPATVKVEVVDRDGSRIIYEGTHRPGEAIPEQTITIAGETKARVLVNGRVRAEWDYQP